MGVARLSPVAAALIAGGKPPETPVCVTQSGTTAAQRSVTGTLATIAADVESAGIRSPAVTVSAPSPRCASSSPGPSLRPLHGRRIVVTRARAQASSLVERLRDLGADVDECAVIRIEPLDGPPIDAGAYGLVCVDLAQRPAAAAGALRRRRACAGGRDGRGDRARHGLRRCVRSGSSPTSWPSASWRRGCWRRSRVTWQACARSSRVPRRHATRCPRACEPRAPRSMSCRSTARLGAVLRHPERMLVRRRCRVHVVVHRHPLRRGPRGPRPVGRARRLDRTGDERHGARARRRRGRGGRASTTSTDWWQISVQVLSEPPEA